MVDGYRCTTCREVEDSTDALARHLMNVHGVNRTSAYKQVGLAQPEQFTARDQHRVSAAVARLLRTSTKHASTLRPSRSSHPPFSSSGSSERSQRLLPTSSSPLSRSDQRSAP